MPVNRPVALFVTVLVGIAVACPALACRCATRPLTEHFSNADVVLFARITSTAPADREGWIEFRVAPVAPPYKGDAEGRSFLTGASSAACGLPARTGSVYLLFGHLDPASPSTVFVDTCGGSRAFDPRDGALQGFDDVPAERVPARLVELQALAATAELVAATGRPGLLGLLDLEPLAHGGSVTLREAPSEDAPVLRNIGSMDELPSREATYEFPAAIVLDRRDGWYGIRIDPRDEGRIGWLPEAAAGTWWPLAELLVRRLAYLTDAWDGLLWVDGAGAGRVLRLAREHERAVEVPESAWIGGSLWLRVVLLDRSPCAGGEPRATHQGWIPARSPRGRPNAWFHARGC